MMDFPASPTVGQIANGYVWNGVLWAGSAPGAGGAIVSISDTAPSAPADNSLFWQSSTGAFYVRYNDGSSTQYVQLNSWPTDLNFVPTTGGTMSGDLTISKTTPTFFLNKGASGEAAIIRGNKAGVNRWAIVLGDATAETGSGNVGSDFGINSYNDAGTFTGSNLVISRATGVVTATGLPPTPKTTASALGEWKPIWAAAGAALSLPAGGTWTWFGFSFVTSTGTISAGLNGGVAAGGTLIFSAAGSIAPTAVCWRIA